MVGYDSGATLADRFRTHAGDRADLYAYAMRGMADDWEAGGPTSEVCAGYQDVPSGAAIQLRLLAGVFRLVLTGRAPELVGFYPCLGGSEPADRVWPVMRRVIAGHVEELHAALAIAPQTNEAGRAAALLAGLAGLVAGQGGGPAPIRLLELGASAGLNLLVDAFGFSGRSADGQAWFWGAARSPLQLRDAIRGPRPPPVRVVERRGCDLHPVDPTSADGRLLLTSFVWPFDLDRQSRLAAALDVAARVPVRVDRAGAAEWLASRLAEPVDRGVLTVVWHSITRQYWTAEEADACANLLEAYGQRQRLGLVTLEFEAGGGPTDPPVLEATRWLPGAPVRRRRVGTAHPHGVPVQVAAA